MFHWIKSHLTLNRPVELSPASLVAIQTLVEEGLQRFDDRLMRRMQRLDATLEQNPSDNGESIRDRYRRRKGVPS